MSLNHSPLNPSPLNPSIKKKLTKTSVNKIEEVKKEITKYFKETGSVISLQKVEDWKDFDREIYLVKLNGDERGDGSTESNLLVCYPAVDSCWVPASPKGFKKKIKSAKNEFLSAAIEIDICGGRKVKYTGKKTNIKIWIKYLTAIQEATVNIKNSGVKMDLALVENLNKWTDLIKEIKNYKNIKKEEGINL